MTKFNVNNIDEKLRMLIIMNYKKLNPKMMYIVQVVSCVALKI